MALSTHPALTMIFKKESSSMTRARETWLSLLASKGKFVFPFFLWVYFFRDFLSGRIVVIDDAFSFYANTKFFLDNLREGVYPLWNPFVLWGIPADINLHQIGELNPFIYVIMLLNLAGLHFYYAFMTSITIYFFLGVIGFYGLAKALLKDKTTAYLASLAVLFSSAGFGIFNQTFMIFLWVPSVYFFYFFLRFFQTSRRKYFAAMTGILVIIVTTYLPFYFLTVFLLALILWLVFFFSRVTTHVETLVRFVRQNKIFVALSLGIIGVSFVFPLTAYQSIRRGDVAVHTRHQTAEATHQKGAMMDYKELSGRISDKMALREFWDNLDEVFYTRDGFVFVSVFLVFVIILTAFNRLTRQGVMLLSLWSLLLFLSLGDVTGLHQLLYKHIFYFKLFRNLYFFTPFLISVFILFAAENFRDYLSNADKNVRRIPWGILGGAGIVLGVLFFLRGQYHMIGTIYLTAIASVAFFILARRWCSFPKRKYLLAALLILVVIEPFEVFFHYGRNARGYRFPIIEEAVRADYHKLGFSFVRPEPQKWPSREGQITIRPDHEFNSYLLARRDSPGLFSIKYGFPTKWSYDFAQNLPEELYQDYIKNKLVLYDLAQEKVDVPYEAFKNILLGKNNLAVVSVDKNSLPAEGINNGATGVAALPTIITPESSLVKVLTFNANSLLLKVNLPQKKFLVYNDSFSPNWQVYYNGQKVPCYRANIAFKGVWLPAGEGLVDFRYAPPGGVFLYVMIIVLFWIYLVYAVYLFVVGRREVGGAGQ